MKHSIRLDPQLAIVQWHNMLGDVNTPARPDNLFDPAFRLIRFDDAWRPLATEPVQITGDGTANVQATWREAYGGKIAYAAPLDLKYPNYWPAAFDEWAWAKDLRHVAPMGFEGEVKTRPVQTPRASGIEFTITIHDLRDPAGRFPQNVIRLPVGIEAPVTPSTRVHGTVEMFFETRQLEHEIRDPALPRSWYYLEAELFGLRGTPPGIVETLQPGRPADRIHCGAPLAVFSGEGKTWWGIAGEPDYGAATLWDENRVRHFTTLYLKPGGTAEWKFIVWRQETTSPQDLLLTATRADGFFNELNPLGFTPHGSPAGPILFANVSRLPFQMEELKKLRPGLVLLNYHYDHISSTANLYGSWRTYEGFAFSEEKLKKLIADLKQLGCRVGYYGTHATQPESHRAVHQDDFFLDAWGRRIHDWEPGNWVADPGHSDAADRYARAEAELGKHYGLEAVFVDRLDYMGINHNPARVGGTKRLKLVPSLRLGLIELNRKRMEWQRRLNPNLHVGLNNVTQWAGVRYSDFNLLEGGDESRDQALAFLYHPAGIVHKRHFPSLFGELGGPSLFQVFEGVSEFVNQSTFLKTLRLFIQRSLASGVIAQPYGDELFVDRRSQFFTPGRDKDAPDEEKNKLLQSIPFHGGQEWRQWWDAVRPALEASLRLTTPIAGVWNRPESGPLPFAHRFLARAGDRGGLYVGILNEEAAAQKVDFKIAGQRFEGDIPAEAVRVWWWDTEKNQGDTLSF